MNRMLLLLCSILSDPFVLLRAKKKDCKPKLTTLMHSRRVDDLNCSASTDPTD